MLSGPTLQKNKTPDTQARQKSNRQMTQTDDIINGCNPRQTRNANLKHRFGKSVGSLLHINICGKNRQLRKSANRCLQFYPPQKNHLQKYPFCKSAREN